MVHIRVVLNEDFENVDSLLSKAEEREEVFVDSISLIVVDDTDLASVRELDHLGILKVDHILNGQRDLDTVTVVVAPEDDSLEALYPFLGAGCTIGSEVVGSMMSYNGKVKTVFVIVNDIG